MCGIWDAVDTKKEPRAKNGNPEIYAGKRK